VGIQNWSKDSNLLERKRGISFAEYRFTSTQNVGKILLLPKRMVASGKGRVTLENTGVEKKGTRKGGARSRLCECTSVVGRGKRSGEISRRSRMTSE